MKAAYSVAVALFLSLFAFSSPVSPEMAMRAARSWIAERHLIDPGGSVTGVVERSSSAGSYFIVLRDSGGAIFVSSDTRFPPIMAVIDRLGTRDNPVLWMADTDSRKMNIALSNSVSRLASGRSPDGVFSSNMDRWSSLMSARRRLSSGSSVPPYIVPGFESGGVFTHWDQNGDDGKKTGVHRPLYNYYMVGPNAGGPESGGLQISSGSASPVTTNAVGTSVLPCGCVATAYAAYLQFAGCTGAVDHINAVNREGGGSTEWRTNSFEVSYPKDLVITPTGSGMGFTVDDGSPFTNRFSAIPGEYNWSILPSNMGGSAPAVEGTSYISDEARELIGRVAFNCGLESWMEYGSDGSGAITINEVWSWGAQTLIDSYYAGMDVDWCHEGFGRMSAVFADGATDTGNPGQITPAHTNVMKITDRVINASRPVIFSINRNGFQGHCVLGVGRDSDTKMTRIFMGYGGDGDGWYATDDMIRINPRDLGPVASWNSIALVIIPSLYGNDVVPVYGKVVNEYGGPVYGARVDVFAELVECHGTNVVASPTFPPSSLRKSFRTGPDGWFRGFYSPLVYSSTGYDSQYHVMAEKVVVNGGVATVSEKDRRRDLGYRVLDVSDGGTVFYPPSETGYNPTYYSRTPLLDSDTRTSYGYGRLLDTMEIGRPLFASVVSKGADAYAAISSEFDYWVSEAVEVDKSVAVFPGEDGVPAALRPLPVIQGTMTIAVSTNVFGSRLEPGEYAFVNPIRHEHVLDSTNILAYGVSTNHFDMIRYSELANQKKGN